MAATLRKSGLDAAGQSNRDCWIIHFVLAKIDAETRRNGRKEAGNWNHRLGMIY